MVTDTAVGNGGHTEKEFREVKALSISKNMFSIIYLLVFFENLLHLIFGDIPDKD